MSQETETKTKKIAVANQKTFRFQGNQDPTQCDKEVNDWILEKTLKKQPPFLGKVCTNHETGEVMYVYMYTETVDVPEEEVKKN